MNLLVTGGAGYIGSTIVERAVARGHAVTVIDNLQEGHRGAVPAACIFVEGDFGDAALLDAVLGAGRRFDAVIHLAAETTVDRSVSDPAIYFRNNTVNGLALIDAMRRHGVDRMVFSSTAATYGEPDTVPITETHSQRPINAYGESKLIFERCLRWYHRAYGLRSVSFRYFNAAGATPEHGEAHRHESHLIPLVLDVAAGTRASVDIYGNDYSTPDGTCVRDYVHVVDIAEAHLLALDRIDSIGLDFFNIGNGVGYTVKQVVEAVRDVTGAPIPTRDCPRRTGDPAVLVASSDRVRAELGWVPWCPGLTEIVATAWQWKLAHPDGYGDGGA
jgi:UDP-glucose 4-epimerase